ncbi:MAG: ATP-grasp domain-containing protein, partial [Oligoflexales bacterium]|nr:ATP-grasp domain-containing protein [Oligoflexales bacterium]
GQFHDPLQNLKHPKTAVILGCGAYRIGTSVEFDWCAVSCSETLQKSNWNSIIINCNPETVSTDYNSSDKLYFEELSLERILDICDIENPDGVIASMGGQTPNKLALPLSEAGLKLLGHSVFSIDHAEDRYKFSKLLDRIGVDQPRWISATDRSDIVRFCDDVGFPVLVRPSYVLSGAAMRVAYDAQSLTSFLDIAEQISRDHPVVVSEFIIGAREIEVDGLAQNGKILSMIVSEHIENAGVHSGDATMVVPAQKLYVETVRRIRKATKAIASELKLNGPFNIQFLAKQNHIRVIECNARAARTFPFISKVVGQNFAEAATSIMLGQTPVMRYIKEDDLPHVGVKAAMFSFTRLPGVDPILGVEMASTGEVGCIGTDLEEALLLAMQASYLRPPKKGILVSAGPEHEKIKFLQSARIFQDLGLPLYATEGTAQYLADHGVSVTALSWPGQGEKDVLHAIRAGLVDFVINIPKNLQKNELSHGAKIRQTAINYNCSIITNMEKLTAYVFALHSYRGFLESHVPRPLPHFIG